MDKVSKFTKLLSRPEYEPWYTKYPKDECLLCKSELQQIIHVFNYWIFMVNIAPYLRYHTMAIPKRCIKEFGELQPEELLEMPEVYEFVKKRYRDRHHLMKHPDGSPIKKYTLTIRWRDDFFDHSDDLARPEHLHIHFMPDKNKMFDPILHNDAHEFDTFNILKDD